MLTLTTPATKEPVTRTEAKRHARIYEGFVADDADIDSLISAARFKFEMETGYALSQATYTWTPETVALEMRLPARPYLSNLVIVDGVDTLVLDTDYTVAVDDKGVAVVTFDATPEEPVLTFRVGYANPGANEMHGAPALAKLAIKMLVAHWYNNREAFAEKALGPVAGTWESIVRNFRLA